MILGIILIHTVSTYYFFLLFSDIDLGIKYNNNFNYLIDQLIK